MTAPENTLLFALNNTLDPAYATRLAAQLGEEAVRSQPLVSFPGAWVYEHRNASVAQAAFYVYHCDDPDVLTKIASRDRRQGVNLALANNPFLGEEGHKIVQARASAMKWSNVIGNLARTADGGYLARLDRLISSPDLSLDAYSQATRLLWVLHEISPSEFSVRIRPVLGVYAKVCGSEIICDYLCYVHQAYSVVGRRWDLLATTPSEMLELLSVEQRKGALADFVSRVIGRRDNGLPIGAEMAREVVKFVDPSEFTTWIDRPSPLCTAAGFAELSKAPGWAEALTAKRVEGSVLRLILPPSGLDEYTDLFSTLGGDRDRLIEVMATLLASQYRLNGEHVAYALACLKDVNDPLIAELVEYGEAKVVINYLMGRWVVGGVERDIIVEPARQVIDRVVERFSNDHASMEQLYQRAQDWDGSSETLNLLIDEVPGLASHLQLTAPYDAYVFERLEGAGVGVEVAIEQFGAHPTEALGKVCALLKAIGRSVDSEQK